MKQKFVMKYFLLRKTGRVPKAKEEDIAPQRYTRPTLAFDNSLGDLHRATPACHRSNLLRIFFART